jgi:tRNA(Arg) A34 adenosine deaminase TadA
MIEALNVAIPDWLADAAAACPPLATTEARMGFVIDLAMRNVRTGSGGPFAAAVFEISGGKLLGAATNLVVTSHCSAAHAELLALSLAQRSNGSYDLGAPGMPRCEIVSSAEPCTMCCGAVLWSGVRRLVFAANDADVRAVGFDEGPKHPDWANELRRRGIEVIGECQRAQAIAVLTAYRAGGGRIYNSRAGVA